MIVAGTMLLAGLVAGAIYSAAPVARILSHSNRYVQYGADALCALACGAVFVLFLHLFAGGRLRMYLFVFFALGFIIFRFILQKLLAKLIKKIYNGLNEGKQKG